MRPWPFDSPPLVEVSGLAGAEWRVSVLRAHHGRRVLEHGGGLHGRRQHRARVVRRRRDGDLLVAGGRHVDGGRRVQVVGVVRRRAAVVLRPPVDGQQVPGVQGVRGWRGRGWVEGSRGR